MAVARKRLVKLESQEVEERGREGGGGVGGVPEWAEANGHGAAVAPPIKKEPQVSGCGLRVWFDLQSVYITQGLSESTKRRGSPGPQLEVSPPPLDVPFDIYKDSSLSPHDSPVLMMRGLLDKGSKENLFLEESTADTSSPALPLAAEKKKKKKLLGRSKSTAEKRERGDSVRSCDQEQDSACSLPTLSPEVGSGHKKKKKKKKEKQASAAQLELERELVLSKTTCADYANQLEVKTLELKQVLQREAFLIRELKEVRQTVTELEAKVRGREGPWKATPTLRILMFVQVSRKSVGVCPHCQSAGHALGGGEGTTPLSAAAAEDTGPNSSHTLLNNLRALWNQSSKKDLT